MTTRNEEAGATWCIESIGAWRFEWIGSEPWPAREMRARNNGHPNDD